MPRELVIGNGRLHVNMDGRGVIRELYYPNPGLDNHINGSRNLIGVWADGEFSWLDDPGWVRSMGYVEDTLVGRLLAANPEMGVEIEVNPAVHHRYDLLLIRVRAANLRTAAREFRLVMSVGLSIAGSSIGNTVLYDPEVDAMHYYKGHYHFLIGGRSGAGGLYQYSAGHRGWKEAWKDAEDGELDGAPITTGSVDCALSLRAQVAPGQTGEFIFWMAAGTDPGCSRDALKPVLSGGAGEEVKEIERYWRSWIRRSGVAASGLPRDLIPLFKRSLLTIRAQTTRTGGILASTDTEMLRCGYDHYGYVWPRDAAFAAHCMSCAGYPEVAESFFGFMERVASDDGFFLHRYNPDGSLGSSWHPRIRGSRSILPIQEDETALPLWALAEYWRRWNRMEAVAHWFDAWGYRAAGFLAGFIDPDTGLPLPSYDLWEERFGVSSFTCATVYAALMGAAELASRLGRPADKYREIALRLRSAFLNRLWDPELGRFLRGFYASGDDGLVPDPTVDSSIWGIVGMGLVPPSSRAARSTLRCIEGSLRVKAPVGGLARYAGDHYFRVSDDHGNVPGNPWLLPVLWLADWYVRAGDLERAAGCLRWSLFRGSESGLLPEQVHPYTGEALSVAPLTWSHAAYAGAAMGLAQKSAGRAWKE